MLSLFLFANDIMLLCAEIPCVSALGYDGIELTLCDITAEPMK